MTTKTRYEKLVDTVKKFSAAYPDHDLTDLVQQTEAIALEAQTADKWRLIQIDAACLQLLCRLQVLSVNSL